MKELEVFLIEALGKQKTQLYTKKTIENIVRLMCILWEKCEFNLDRLSCIYSDESLTIEGEKKRKL